MSDGPGAMSARTAPILPAPASWRLPDRGIVGMVSLIVAETAIFTIFVVAYLYYLGKNLSGPEPRQVLEVPVFISICLWASSATVELAVRALRRGSTRPFGLWWLATIVLAAVFLGGTAREWYHLIYVEGFTIRTNLFGTTFYSLVGLHAFHVMVGLVGLALVQAFAFLGRVGPEHAHRTHVLGLYWHFVDAVWVVVFTVVYVIGR
jgi:cytochrome c oxidase subunit 3